MRGFRQAAGKPDQVVAVAQLMNRRRGRGVMETTATLALMVINTVWQKEA